MEDEGSHGDGFHWVGNKHSQLSRFCHGDCIRSPVLNYPMQRLLAATSRQLINWVYNDSPPSCDRYSSSHQESISLSRHPCPDKRYFNTTIKLTEPPIPHFTRLINFVYCLKSKPHKSKYFEKICCGEPMAGSH